MKKEKYITKINETTYRIRFRISKNADGTSNYYSKQLSNVTFEDAKKFCAEQRERLIRRKNDIVNYNMTMNDFAKIWLEDYVRINSAPSTYTEKCSKYKHYIAPYIGKLKMNEITKEDANKFLNKLRTINGVSKKEPLSENTVAHIVRCASSLFEYAIEQNQTINTNHFQKLKFKHIDKGEVIAYNSTQKQKIIQKLDNESFIFKVIVLTALYCGLRRGEISSLRFSSIREDGNGGHFLRIKESTTQTKEFGTLDKQTKNGDWRDVPLPEVLYNYYMECAKWQQGKHISKKQKKGEIREFISTFNQNNYIFQKDNYIDNALERITPNGISKRWSSFTKKYALEFPTYKFHSLRATYASDLIQSKKFTSQEIQYFLGHKSYSTTLKYYSALDKTSVSRASNLLNNDLLNILERGDKNES